MEKKAEFFFRFYCRSVINLVAEIVMSVDNQGTKSNAMQRRKKHIMFLVEAYPFWPFAILNHQHKVLFLYSCIREYGFVFVTESYLGGLVQCTPRVIPETLQ